MAVQAPVAVWLAARWRAHRRELLIALIVGGVAAAVGGPVGLLWRAVAPRVELILSPYGWYPLEAEPEGFIADDVWFVIFSAGAAVLVALGAWVLARRTRGPVVFVTLVAGAFAGALFAEWLGHRIGLTGYQHLIDTAAEGTRLHRQVSLRSDVALLVAPAGAAVVYTLFAAFHYAPSLRDDDADDSYQDDPDLGPDLGPEPDGADLVSSAPSASPAQPAAPAPPGPGSAARPPDAAGTAPPAAG